MSQFSVYRNKGRNSDHIPFVLDVQSDLVSLGLSTRIAVPLYKAAQVRSPALRIHVSLKIKRTKTVALFDELSAVPLSVLGKPVAQLEEKEVEECKKALDCIFFGIP